MEARGLTASAVIDLIRQLEDASAQFYTAMASAFEQHQAKLLAYAVESKKNRDLVTRTYQETISDALEAGFCFEGLVFDAGLLRDTLPEGADLRQAVQMAIALEDDASHFYQAAADLSQSLLATVTRALARVARNRGKRKAELAAMLDDG